jgi:hypothetical protein
MGTSTLLFIVSSGDRKAIERQRALLTRAARRTDSHVSEVSEHVTEAKSLRLELSSKAIEEFFEVTLSSGAKLLAIESPGRLAADATTVEVVVAQLEHVGLRVVFVNSPGKAAASIELRRALRMALSTEKLFRQARIKIGRKRNAVGGGKHGGNPRYGTLPGEESVLRHIQELASKDALGHTAIAALLNSDGVKPRNAKQWQPAVIANILGVRREAHLRTLRRDKRRKE